MKIGLEKLTKPITNACEVQMRYEKNVNTNTAHSLLMLNPECQIKILEKNLKFLFQKDSSYSYFQIKSNHLSLRTESKDSVIESASNGAEPKPILITRSQPTIHHKGDNKGIHIEGCKRTCVEENCNNNLANKKEIFIVKSNILKDKKVKNKRQLNSAAQFSSLKQFYDHNEENDTSKMDIENQYEFTLEQEKIVSYVCNTSPQRKLTDKSSSDTEFSDDQTVLSDHSSEKCAKPWTDCNGESDSLSGSVASSTLRESNKTNTIVVDTDYLSTFTKITDPSKLLWHPPSSLSCDSLDTPKAKKPSCPAVFVNFNSNNSNSDNRITSDSFQRKMESSFSRETTLFRETSLRGCYNMENIVKDVIPPQTHVQQELKIVKEAIFSAVRSQQNSDDLVSDSVLSMLDMCKSWLRLSSHFKGKEFMDILESHGINPSIFDDFLQWQCVSRVFIDKMIDILQKVTPKICRANDSSTLKDLSGRTLPDVKNFVYSPNYLNMHNSVNSTNTRQIENNLSSSTCEINPNKNWKQRRFFLDQPKQVIVESKNTYGPNYLGNTYNNCSQPHNPCRSDMLYGQGDPPLCYNSESHCTINHQFPDNNSYSGQADVSLSLNSLSISHGNVSNSYRPDNPNLPFISKSVKHFFRDRSGTKLYQTPVASNVTNEFPTLSLPISPHSSASTPNLTIVPPFYNSHMCCSNSSNYQLNPSQLTVKQNPIQCADIDIVEKCPKTSYMKPGSYNIPEKPKGFQKIINNNIPIEDSPVVGVPFLFSGPQGSIISPKPISSISKTENQGSNEDKGERKSEEKWKAAKTSAETFRDNLMASVADSEQNVKSSDTVTINTHFLLSDEFSQSSLSNDCKLSIESKETSSCERTNPAMDVSVVEAKVKTSDWLMQSFNKAVLESEREVPNFQNCTIPNWEHDTGCEVKDMYKTNCKGETLASNEIDGINSYYNSFFSVNCSQNCLQFDEKVNSKPELSVVGAVDTKSESNDASLLEDETNRNNSKLQDLSASCLLDHKFSLFRKKAKPVFNRAITKPISNKLEDILNCICSTQVSSLVEFGYKSEKVSVISNLFLVQASF